MVLELHLPSGRLDLEVQDGDQSGWEGRPSARTSAGQGPELWTVPCGNGPLTLWSLLGRSPVSSTLRSRTRWSRRVILRRRRRRSASRAGWEGVTHLRPRSNRPSGKPRTYIEIDTYLVMMSPAPTHGPMPSRLIGFYALSVMAAEGPLHGYMLAERIADRTDGAWRPGAGAIYPALETLTERQLARVTSEGRRRVYRITPKGRLLLRTLRRGMAWRTRGGPDLGRLWSEIAGVADPGQFMLENLRRRLDGIVNYLSRDGSDPSAHRALRERFRSELRLAEERLGGFGSSVPPRAPRSKDRAP